MADSDWTAHADGGLGCKPFDLIDIRHADGSEERGVMAGHMSAETEESEGTETVVEWRLTPFGTIER